MLTDNPDNGNFELFIKKTGDGMTITNHYPATTDWYTHLETPNAKEFKSKKLFDDPQTLRDLAPSEIGYFSCSTTPPTIAMPSCSRTARKVPWKYSTKMQSGPILPAPPIPTASSKLRNRCVPC